VSHLVGLLGAPVRSGLAEARSLIAALEAARRSPTHELPMVVNSIALIAAKVSSLGLGFLAWLVAARLFEASDVGVAAAVVAAMMLCVQLGLVGVGSSIINLFPSRRQRPAPLLDTAFSTVAVAATVAGCTFLVLAAFALRELRPVVLDVRFTVAFLALTLLGTVGVLLDQVSTVMRRGDEALVRNVVSGGVTVVLIGALGVAGTSDVALGVVLAWLVGNLAAVGVGWWQLRRSALAYRYRPVLEPPLARGLVGIGLPNWLLTLAERAPGPVLPIVVTEVLSPAANAHWYIVWMLAWVVFIVPIQVGLSAFAEASHRPEALELIVRRAVRTSLAIGTAGAVATTLLADVVLRVLGGAYAAEGAVPLRILVWTVVPMSFVQAYFSVCRATRRLREATLASTAGTGIGILAGAAGAAAGGLPLMAATWLVSQSLLASWSIVRLRRLVRRPAAQSGPAPAAEEPRSPGPVYDPAAANAARADLRG
jgi:O-antigen/teichoic acid export membrane protein